VFGSPINIRERLVCATVDEYVGRIQQFVRGHARKESDVALVYLPKVGDVGDAGHPYFRVKGLLAREGLVSQMVDEATLQNPTWRDLNLALDIYAKAGYVPWVLDEAIPNADLFIGLSSSQVKRNGVILRMMGYVNVFDSYGRWQFYQGDTSAFSFADRLAHYRDLVRNSIGAYQEKNGGEINVVHIHLTKPFSRDERQVLASAVRERSPEASVVFVWIDIHHQVRLYDLSPRRNGYISRATYVPDGSEVYLATTGNNVFGQKGMGTPLPLRLVTWADPMEALPSPRQVAQQILSLTRLNWGSTRNFCQEPITTKFAGDIAGLMSKFLEDPTFTINPLLRDAPWFL
jgi:argonaute-like protein implicated in RNA metabolism and viral defense